MSGPFADNDRYNIASYGKIANRYAVYRPSYPQELFDTIIALVDRRGTALDCATGTGQAASKLTSSFDNVLAYDVSLDQIEHLRPAQNLFGFTARSEAVPLQRNTVDLVTVAQAVHWI